MMRNSCQFSLWLPVPWTTGIRYRSFSGHHSDLSWSPFPGLLQEWCSSWFRSWCRCIGFRDFENRLRHSRNRWCTGINDWTGRTAVEYRGCSGMVTLSGLRMLCGSHLRLHGFWRRFLIPVQQHIELAPCCWLLFRCLSWSLRPDSLAVRVQIGRESCRARV